MLFSTISGREMCVKVPVLGLMSHACETGTLFFVFEDTLGYNIRFHHLVFFTFSLTVKSMHAKQFGAQHMLSLAHYIHTYFKYF